MTNNALSQGMHSLMVMLFQEMHKVEPNQEMMDFIKSPSALKMVKAIADFYSSILTEEEIQWVVNENLNGTGAAIMEKFIQNIEQFRQQIVPIVKEFEIQN